MRFLTLDFLLFCYRLSSKRALELQFQPGCLPQSVSVIPWKGLGTLQHRRWSHADSRLTNNEGVVTSHHGQVVWGTDRSLVADIECVCVVLCVSANQSCHVCGIVVLHMIIVSNHHVTSAAIDSAWLVRKSALLLYMDPSGSTSDRGFKNSGNHCFHGTLLSKSLNISYWDIPLIQNSDFLVKGMRIQHILKLQ